MDRNKDQYLKIVKDRQDYLGVKYFRFNLESDTVVQVCLSPGNDRKRGRSNNVGIYTISRLTLLTNYWAPSYVESCTKREFEQQFDKIVNALR